MVDRLKIRQETVADLRFVGSRIDPRRRKNFVEINNERMMFSEHYSYPGMRLYRRFGTGDAVQLAARGLPGVWD